MTAAGGSPGRAGCRPARGCSPSRSSASSNSRAERGHQQVDLGGEVAVEGARARRPPARPPRASGPRRSRPGWPARRWRRGCASALSLGGRCWVVVGHVSAMIGTRSTSRKVAGTMRVALLSYRSKPHCGGQGDLRPAPQPRAGPARPRGRGVLGPALPRPRRGCAADQGAQPRPLPRARPVPGAAPREFRDLDRRRGGPDHVHAGFPEPQDVRRRVARVLAGRLDDFDVVARQPGARLRDARDREDSGCPW